LDVFWEILKIAFLTSFCNLIVKTSVHLAVFVKLDAEGLLGLPALGVDV